MKKKWYKVIPFVIVAGTLGVLLFSSVFMMLWNGILPAVIHAGSITLWQAAGILVLGRMLFGGFKGRRMMAGACRQRNWNGSRAQMYMGCRKYEPAPATAVNE